MDERIERLEYWKKYFLHTEDYESKVWDFPERYTSQFLIGDKNFQLGDASWWITLVDTYKGRAPFLWNKEFFLNESSIPIFIIHSLLLDSQVVNEIHKYVIDQSSLDQSKKVAIREFITFYKNKGCDISSLFYIFEALNKSDPDKRKKYITDRIRTIFLLQTMDANKFKKTGEVVINPVFEKRQLEFHNAGSLPEYISKAYDFLHEAYVDSQIDLVADLSYVCLIKMAILKKQNLAITNKILTMREFLLKTVGLMAGPELFLSLCYFVNPKRYQRFVPPLQHGMKFENFTRKVRSSAWDMLLIRLPFMLNNVGTPHISNSDTRFSLSYICTAEHAIRDVIRPMKIQTIFNLNEKLGGQRLLFEFDINDIEGFFGDRVIDEVLRDNFEYIAQDMNSFEIKARISREALVELTDELENEAQLMCE